MNTYWGSVGIAPRILKRMEVYGQIHALAALTPEKWPPVTDWMGGWVGPKAGLNTVAKRKNPIIAPAGNWTLVVQPVA